MSSYIVSRSRIVISEQSESTNLGSHFGSLKLAVAACSRICTTSRGERQRAIASIVQSRLGPEIRECVFHFCPQAATRMLSANIRVLSFGAS